VIVDIKQNEKDRIFGGKKIVEHICGITKEIAKSAGLAYCIALNNYRQDGLLGKIGRLNEPQRKGLCSAIIVGTTEIAYHILETFFDFDEKPSNREK
jgi:hypothetical protein